MLSIVVPAHNEEHLLDRTLVSLRAAADALAQPYEIIVVDDASTDRTAAIARARGAEVVSVAYRQIARTRNAGARVAKGDLLIFVDADTLVPAETLRATLDACRAGAVGGGATLYFDGPLARWSIPVSLSVRFVMRTCRLAAGCYFFCTREVFAAVGGFDERLFALEEIALSRAVRRRGPVVILQESVVSSGRKLRHHSGRDMVRLILTFMRRGPGMFRGRDHLPFWYGERRHES